MNNPLLIGLASGGLFLLAFLLYNHPKNQNKKANKWLSLFVATLAASTLHIFLHNLNLQAQYQKVLLLIEVSEFLTAPALYLSILFFTIPSRDFRKSDIWHFAPALLILLFLMTPLLTGKNVAFPNELLKEVVLTVLFLLRPIQLVLYLVLSYQQLARHQQTIKQVSAYTDETDLSWLKHLIAVWAIVVIAWFNLAFFNFVHLSNYTPYLYFISLYFLAHFSLKQQEVYAFAPAVIRELEPVISTTKSTQKAEKQKRLSDSQLAFFKDKLERLMQYGKAYLDNELSLPALALQVGMSAHELSYLINEVYGENFYSFVNRHRVEEAKRLLLSQSHGQLNMLGIAYKAGFNSKTTFNIAFKKWTGQSPTQFSQSPVAQKRAEKV